MSTPVETRTVLNSQKLYERLLALYPKAHRQEYGPPMVQLFRDQSRNAWREARSWGVACLWLQVLPDLLRTSFLEHLSELKGEKSMAEKISELARPSSAPVKAFFGVAGLVFLTVFMLSTIITFLLPETFASTARIKLEPDAAVAPGQNGLPGAASAVYDPYFIQTEFEVIQSEVVLGKVIESLDLNTAWGKKYGGGNKLKTSESLGILKGRLDLRPIRNTSFIEVRVFSEDPKEAAQIANATAEAYREHRLRERVEKMRGGIHALEQRYAEQTEKVRATQQQLDRLRAELGLSDADASQSAPAPAMETETLRKLAGVRIEQEMKLKGMESQLDRFKALNKTELREALTTTISDAILVQLISQLNLADQSLETIRQDRGSQHPDVQRAERQVKLLNQKIDDRLTGVMSGLATQVATTQAELDTLQKSVAEAKDRDSDKATRSRPFYEKKRELDELQSFGRILGMKIASERVDIGLPKTLVEIMDRAVPGLRPVRPNKPLNLALGAVGGAFLALFVGGVAAWLVSKNRKDPPPRATGI